MLRFFELPGETLDCARMSQACSQITAPVSLNFLSSISAYVSEFEEYLGLVAVMCTWHLEKEHRAVKINHQVFSESSNGKNLDWLDQQD